MNNFKSDLTKLVNEGILVPNNGTIRFVFRYSNRFKGELDCLDLNTRAINCLRRAGIHNVEQLGERWDSLSRIRNSGAKTVREIKNKYISYYYSLLKTEEDKKEFWEDTIKGTYSI